MQNNHQNDVNGRLMALRIRECHVVIAADVLRHEVRIPKIDKLLKELMHLADEIDPDRKKDDKDRQ